MRTDAPFRDVRRRLGERIWEGLVHRYVWWKSADEAALYPEQVIAQAMNLGGFDEWALLRDRLGDETLSQVLRIAWPGWFDARAWNYWHLVLDEAASGDVPPLPRRVLP